jgi:beta-N-acetylhexosaminidase
MFEKVCRLLVIGFLVSCEVLAQKGGKKPELSGQDKWVDSVFNALTREQKLGQLFMIAAYSNKDEKHYAEIESLVKTYHVGGLIFFQGGPVRQALLTNRYQKVAAVPLMIGMDAEWGLGMRLDSTISFPKQMTLGAIQDNQYIYNMGAEIARQCNLMGVHINFAPVIDVNSNPGNPVIGDRSFGENKYWVAEKGIAYMKGLQHHKVLASAKHFPGHGDTDTDSHLALPVIKHQPNRLADLELFPFRKLFEDTLMSTMVAHLHIPTLDNTPNRATTLSPVVVNGLLKKEMGFKGLVFTDALNMKGVSKFYDPGDVDLMALLAGNDVLLFSQDVPLAVKKIAKAIKDGKLKQEDLDERVKKILKAKYWAGLHQTKYLEINTDHLYNALNSPKARLLKQKLYEQAITVVKNDDKFLPVKSLDTLNMASLSIGLPAENAFTATLNQYGAFVHYSPIVEGPPQADIYQNLYERLRHYNLIIVGVNGIKGSSLNNFGLKKEEIALLRRLNTVTKVVVNVFGSPYSLRYFENFSNVVCAYQEDEVAHKVVPQILFGAIGAKGRLPVSSSSMFLEGMGEDTKSLKRLAYSIPEDVGMDSKILNKIDQLIEETIQDRATPGCQVLVARKGAVVFQKSYGHLTYDKQTKVNDQTIYDIASVTKVAATTQVMMFLEGKGKLNFKDKASVYLPELKKSNKKDLYIDEILTHQAGLKPFIPFYQNTLDESGFSPKYYSPYPETPFTLQITPKMYAIHSLKDSVWQWTIDSEIKEKKKGAKYHDYKYSDIGFYIMQRIAEGMLNQSMAGFLDQNLYEPLGCSTLGYLPLCKFPQDRIAPTEADNNFRKTLICGMVHDEGAALYGGVAGHAGLFSNANDLAILMQMNLQDGYYGGTRYFPVGTVQKFTAKRFDKNRRGLGWDKPSLDNSTNHVSEYASPKTYGHTGFTGSAVWVDPEFDLVFVFLSNRVHPDVNNTKLLKNNIRTRVQDIVYQSIFSYEKKNF